MEVAAWCELAESLGYARVGIGDSPALHRAPWVVLTLAAQRTRRVPIGLWVTNPLTRHPVVTASAAATVDELAPGRVCIGLGGGDSAVYNVGQKTAKAEVLREYACTIKGLLARGEAHFQGRRVLLAWARKRIPIYVSAHGSKAIRVAGQVADGVIMGLGKTPQVIRECLRVLGEGAESAGRDVREIDVWWNARYIADERPGVSRRSMAGIITDFAFLLAKFTMDGKFIPEQYREPIARLAAAYDIAQHGKTEPALREKYARLAYDLGVAEYLVDRYCFAGTPSECLSQIEEAVTAGATQFMYSMRGPDRSGKLRAWHDLVLRRLWGT